MSFLNEVVSNKRSEIHERKNRAYLQDIQSKISDADPTRGFAKALCAEGGQFPNLIAEVKKASPSKGVIRADFHPTDIAQIYEDGGASALSVLTETRYFLGDPAYLRQIRAKVALPLLQKDFILDELQIHEARAWGADAILLIVAILEATQIKDYFDLAQSLSLDVLIEVHSEKELEKVIEWAPVIGINNRNLTTFETKIETSFRVLREIPNDRTVVSESGIRSRAELEMLKEAGIHAVLIGETFMAAEKIDEKMKALFGD